MGNQALQNTIWGVYLLMHFNTSWMGFVLLLGGSVVALSRLFPTAIIEISYETKEGKMEA